MKLWLGFFAVLFFWGAVANAIANHGWYVLGDSAICAVLLFLGSRKP